MLNIITINLSISNLYIVSIFIKFDFIVVMNDIFYAYFVKIILKENIEDLLILKKNYLFPSVFVISDS